MPIGQYIICRNDLGLTHTAAVALATERGATLAAITSAEENTIFLGFLAEDDQLWGGEPRDNARNGPWIGLTQSPDSAEPSGGWTWDTGETLDFTAWHPAQPDNYIGDSFAFYWDAYGSIGWGDHVEDPVGAGYGPIVTAAIEVDRDIKGLLGTEGHDFIWGGSISNVIKGLGGDDILKGNAGRDRILAGRGDDSLSGGKGDDRLIGNAGSDTMTGGAGIDTFAFLAPDDSKPGAARDAITDFVGGLAGDIIDISELPGIFTFKGDAAFDGDNQVRIAASGEDFVVEINISGSLDAEMRIDIGAATGLIAANFLL